MNKITSSLAGLALVAAASVAPASAQGFFTNKVPFTFTQSAGTFTVNPVAAVYDPFAGAAENGTLGLILTGGNGSGTFTGATLTFTPTVGMKITDSTFKSAFVNSSVGGPGSDQVSGGPSGKGNFFILNNAPVPEASTVVSFGALLALGGLAVLRRKSVKNAG